MSNKNPSRETAQLLVQALQRTKRGAINPKEQNLLNEAMQGTLAIRTLIPKVQGVIAQSGKSNVSEELKKLFSGITTKERAEFSPAMARILEQFAAAPEKSLTPKTVLGELRTQGTKEALEIYEKARAQQKESQAIYSFTDDLDQAANVLEKFSGIGLSFIKGIGKESLVSAIREKHKLSEEEAHGRIKEKGFFGSIKEEMTQPKGAGFSGLLGGIINRGLPIAAAATAGYVFSEAKKMGDVPNLMRAYQLRAIGKEMGLPDENLGVNINKQFNTGNKYMTSDQFIEVAGSAVKSGMQGSKITDALASLQPHVMGLGVDIVELGKTLTKVGFGGFNPTETAANLLDKLNPEKNPEMTDVLAAQMAPAMAGIFNRLGRNTFGMSEGELNKALFGKGGAFETTNSVMRGFGGPRGLEIIETAYQAQSQSASDLSKGYLMAALTGKSPGQAMGQMATTHISPQEIQGSLFNSLAQMYISTYVGKTAGLTMLARDYPMLIEKIATVYGKNVLPAGMTRKGATESMHDILLGLQDTAMKQLIELTDLTGLAVIITRATQSMEASLLTLAAEATYTNPTVHERIIVAPGGIPLYTHQKNNVPTLPAKKVLSKATTDYTKQSKENKGFGQRE